MVMRNGKDERGEESFGMTIMSFNDKSYLG
jgi:hypothetical protein